MIQKYFNCRHKIKFRGTGFSRGTYLSCWDFADLTEFYIVNVWSFVRSAFINMVFEKKVNNL